MIGFDNKVTQCSISMNRLHFGLPLSYTFSFFKKYIEKDDEDYFLEISIQYQLLPSSYYSRFQFIRSIAVRSRLNSLGDVSYKMQYGTANIAISYVASIDWSLKITSLKRPLGANKVASNEVHGIRWLILVVFGFPAFFSSVYTALRPDKWKRKWCGYFYLVCCSL